ncbi:MAG: hypothetical protein KME47_25730 [Nodosilinea sp. WJT8-NPBG4]|jgi:hypothetical protein|nr:hypothetical protein [Nodosilinea sp. WJT8-NPBG4]
MGEKFHRRIIKQRLRDALGGECNLYPLIVQVGSSVASNASLCADVDVIGLVAPNSTWERMNKRVFPKKGELNIEFTTLPLNIPFLLAEETELHFYFFRERKKLEHSVLLFGSSELHAKLVSSLQSLPLPLSKIASTLETVAGLHSECGQASSRELVNSFFILTVLLGYTHFRKGPVKPKWLLDEIKDSGLNEAEMFAHIVTQPAVSYGLARLHENFECIEAFTDFWNRKGTAWQDAKFFCNKDLDASALVTLYCLNAYMNMSLPGRSDAAIRCYKDLLCCLEPHRCNLNNLLSSLINQVKTALTEASRSHPIHHSYIVD